MINGTRTSLEGYSTALLWKGASGHTTGASSPPLATDNELTSIEEQIADHHRVSPAPESSESKAETPPEPAMPAKTPPPLPHAKMPCQDVIEDPFAEVNGKEDSDPGGVSSPVESQGQLQQKFLSNETKAQGGFDAFSPGADAFESDPFAINAFNGNGVGDAAIDDPFSAADAVFTNATAVASDGFDAFPSSPGALFDAFGQ